MEGLLYRFLRQALPYVNGSLNSFLSNQAINEEAKKSGLKSALEYHRDRNSGEIKKHLDHILKIHNRDYTDDTKDYETADDDSVGSQISTIYHAFN